MAVVLITIPNTFAVIPFLNKKGPIVKPLPISEENAQKLKEMGFDVKVVGESSQEEKPAEPAPIVKEPVKEPEPKVKEELKQEETPEQVVPEGFALYEGELENSEGITLYTDPEGKICTLNADGSVNEYFDVEEESEAEENTNEEEKTSSKKKKRRK